MKRVQVSIPNIVLLVLTALASVATPSVVMAQEPMSDDTLQEHLLESERQFFGALKDRDAALIRRLSGDDGFYVHPPGIHTIERVIDDMTGYTVGEFSLGPEVHLQRLDENAVALAYALTIGWPSPSVDWLMTAIYVNRNGQWVGVYRAETR